MSEGKQQNEEEVEEKEKEEISGKKHQCISVSGNVDTPRGNRFFFVEVEGDDVEFGSDPLGASVTRKPSLKHTSVPSLLSMIPEEESESESSSSSSSSSSSTSTSSSSSSSSISDDNDNIIVINNNNNNRTSSMRSKDHALPWLNNNSKWGTKSLETNHKNKEETVIVKTSKIETEKKVTPTIKENGEINGKNSSIDPIESFLPQGNDKVMPWDRIKLFLNILSFCECQDLCQIMLVSKRFYQLTTHDILWKNILTGMNLQPLLNLPNAPTKDYYKYFIEKITTTKALHGHYFFEAATSEDGWNSLNNTLSSVKTLPAGRSPTNTVDDSIFLIESVTLLLSSASLGQLNHSIGRVQLLIEYKDKATEVIQGAARFSWRKGCFIFCCSSFGSPLRGPVFTVAISNVMKPWPNQSLNQFEAHKGGLRFIMTPALLEGNNPGSRITEMDLVSVSRPPILEG